MHFWTFLYKKRNTSNKYDLFIIKYYLFIIINITSYRKMFETQVVLPK